VYVFHSDILDESSKSKNASLINEGPLVFGGQTLDHLC
jgi:hypothetical protein